MSKSLVKKLSAVTVLGLVIGASTMFGYSKYQKNQFINASRRVASDKISDKRLEMGKHLAVVSVQINPEDVPASENDEITLTGYITLNQPSDGDLHYKWALPDDVSVVAGQSEDSIANVKSGQTVKTQVTLTGFSKETLKLISLHGFIQKGEQQYGNTAVITSRPEDSMEYVAPAMAQSAAFKDFEDGKKVQGKIVK